MRVGILQQKVTQGLMIFSGILIISLGSFAVKVIFDMQKEITKNNNTLKQMDLQDLMDKK
jgi:hypothetical protein